MPEIVGKNNTIDTAIRMVTDGDERPAFAQFRQLRKYIRGLGKHIILYTQILKNTVRKVRATEVTVAFV